jgi:hypothetical protein
MKYGLPAAPAPIIATDLMRSLSAISKLVKYAKYNSFQVSRTISDKFTLGF